MSFITPSIQKLHGWLEPSQSTTRTMVKLWWTDLGATQMFLRSPFLPALQSSYLEINHTMSSNKNNLLGTKYKCSDIRQCNKQYNTARTEKITVRESNWPRVQWNGGDKCRVTKRRYDRRIRKHKETVTKNGAAAAAERSGKRWRIGSATALLASAWTKWRLVGQTGPRVSGRPPTTVGGEAGNTVVLGRLFRLVERRSRQYPVLLLCARSSRSAPSSRQNRPAAWPRSSNNVPYRRSLTRLKHRRLYCTTVLASSRRSSSWSSLACAPYVDQ